MLAQLTLIRSSRYDIPSGQDIARHMGIPVLANNKLGLSQTAYPSFNGEAPLWFYMLAESELKENGARLGDVGGRIIAEVFLDQLAVDPASYLNARRPFTPSVEHEGDFTMGDFLTFAGVVELKRKRNRSSHPDVRRGAIERDRDGARSRSACQRQAKDRWSQGDSNP